MPDFKGFPDGKTRLIQLPGSFFTELLPQFDNLDELKLILYFFWRLDQLEGAFRYLRCADIFADAGFIAGMGATPEAAQAAIEAALEQAVARGALLHARLDFEAGTQSVYFLNSPKGRAAIRAIQNGSWRLAKGAQQPILEVIEPPNIFRLYEENIGPLAPMIADGLKEAEATYPLPWIEEAIRIAVEKNVRNLRYITAILERWRREGKHGEKDKSKDRPDSPETGRAYVEGKYSEFIEH